MEFIMGGEIAPNPSEFSRRSNIHFFVALMAFLRVSHEPLFSHSFKPSSTHMSRLRQLKNSGFGGSLPVMISRISRPAGIGRDARRAVKIASGAIIVRVHDDMS